MIDERCHFWSGDYGTMEHLRGEILQHVGDEVVDFPCEGPGWYFGTFESKLLEPTACVLLVTVWEDDYKGRGLTVRAYEEDPRPMFRAIFDLPVYGGTR